MDLDLFLAVIYHIVTDNMARKQKQKGQKTPNFSLHAKPNGSSKGKKLESYEDTLEPGSTDEREYWVIGI